MSIAYEINRLKLNKQQVKEQVNVDKDIINEGREFIRGETVRHYPSRIKSMEMSYKDFIPVHTSTESLIETERGGTIIKRHLMGNTTQDGTPTPSSPVAIKSVTGLQNFSICGKNLYDKNNVTSTGASNQNIKFTTTLLPNTQYTFNITSNRTWGTIYLYDSSNTQTRTIGNYSDANKLTFTTSASEVKGDFIFKADTNVDVSTYDFTGVQLEKGSTATTYEPYKLAKKGTKNLFDKYNVIAGYRFDSEGELYQNNGCNATNFIDVQPNTTYSTSWSIVWNEVICLYDAEFNFTRRLISGTSFTTEPNEYYIRADVTDSHLSTAQIEEGSTTTSYVDPYETNFEIDLGKNIFDSNSEIKEDWFDNSGITYTINNGTYILNGTNTRQYIYLRYNLELEAGDYFLSGCPSGGSNAGYSSFVRVGSTNYADYGSGVTFNIPTKQEVLFYPVRIGSETITANNLTFKPMIEKGKIELNKIGDYQDFIRKGTGKNLFNGIFEIGGYDTTSNGEKDTAENRVRCIDYIEVSPNTTYIFSFKNNGSVYCLEYDSNKTYLNKSTLVIYHVTTGSFTTSANTKYITFYYIPYNHSVSISEKCQLEKGSQVTYYEPYGYKDKWYIEKNIGRVVLDSNCDVASFQAGTTSGVYRFAVGVTGIDSIGIDDAGTDSPLFCNILKPTNRDKTYAKIESMCYGMATNTVYKNFLIYTDETKNYDVATFKTWLGTKKPVVYYVLSSPTFETISDSTLISQLNENIYLLEGQNNISVSGNLPTGIDVDYIERVNKHLIGNTNESAK